MQRDFSHRFIFENQPLRGVLVRIEESYQTILSQRDYPKVIQGFLGEVLLSNILLCNDLKYSGEITMQMQQENSPIKMLVAKCNDQLQIRGLASWREGFHEQMLIENLSAGRLIITMQPSEKRQQYQSIVEIASQPISQIMEFFFQQSEQLPTSIWMATSDKSAVAILLQQLPSEDGRLEAVDIWKEVNVLTETVTMDELFQLDTETLLHRLYSEHDLRLFESKPVQFYCPCSQSKMEGALLMMGYEEAIGILDQHQVILVTCEYCQQEFGFDREQVRTIFSRH